MDLEYKDYFNVTEYYFIVKEIVDGYFDDLGDYAPHLGDMSAMLLFFNLCIENKELLTEEKEITDPFEAEVIFANEDFIRAFNEAIFFDGDIRYDFANAYKNAMEIVQYRINSPSYAVNQAAIKMNEVLGGIGDIVDSVNSVMNEETVNKLVDFAQKVSDGKYDAKAVSDAFAESEAFKKIANMERS